MPMPPYKLPDGSISQSNHGSFRGNGSKGAASSKITWGHLKDAKADFKSPSKSYISDKKLKRERVITTGSNSYDSRKSTRLRQSSLSTRPTNIIEPMLALIVMTSVICSLIAPSQNPDSLRVL